MGKAAENRVRLDKMLADLGLGTRSQIKDMARRGRIQVNGVTEKKADVKVNPEADQVTVDNALVSYARFEYYMLNKPQGVVSATEDPVHDTVLDLIRGKAGEPVRKDLFPAGRLDIDTEGLLLITNDGELAHGLLSPRHHVDKRYFARVEGELPPDVKKRFADGITLADGTRTMPARLEILSGDHPQSREEGGGLEVILTIREGKFHQVKRMFEAVGSRVSFLKRLSIGSLVLDESLEPGAYRALTEEEVEELKKWRDTGRRS